MFFDDDGNVGGGTPTEPTMPPMNNPDEEKDMAGEGSQAGQQM